MNEIRNQLFRIADRPRGLEQRILAARFSEFAYHLGEDDAIVQQSLQGQTPEAAATALLDQSILATADGAARALNDGTLTMDDPAMRTGSIAFL